jgi:hypothetical protein
MNEAPAPPPVPSNDESHLRALSISWYVMSALSALCGCGSAAFFVAFSQMFTKAIESMPANPNQPPPPPEFARFFGFMYGGMGLVYGIGGLVFAVLELLTARWLAARRNRTFCLVMAAISCLWVPLGTVLGVFTIVVLVRPSVEQAFAQSERRI